ncbi:MAG TPA: DUF4097 family beta strand repeat-containing protein [Rhodanobacteraceae bacterium]
MKILFCTLPLALALLSPTALADTPINQTHALAPNAELTVRNVAGAITVTTWDKPEVRITGSLGDNVRKLEIKGDAHDLTIAVKGPKDGDSGWLNWGDDNSMGPSTLVLTVPKGVELNLKSVSARIQATGLAGGELEAKSVSGNIVIDATSPEVDIDSVSGDVRLTGAMQEVEVTTVSGDISVAKASHKAATQSVSGDIHIIGGPLRSVHMESVSGDLYLDGTLTTHAQAKLHSMSGDIHLTLPGQPAATLTASSFSGDIHSAWGKVVQPQYGPGSSLDTTIGNGGAQVSLKTFSGDVDIRQGR